MDLQTLRERIITEVMRQLEQDGAVPGAAGCAPCAAESAAPAAGGSLPPSPQPPGPWPVRSPERAAQLAGLQAACALDPAVPERVDVLVVLTGRDQVGSGLEGARNLIHQGHGAALVTTPEVLEATGPGLLYEVLSGGPAFCRGDAAVARRLARAARVVLVPCLTEEQARALVARTPAGDLPAQVLVEALALRKPVFAAPTAAGAAAGVPAAAALAQGTLAAAGITLVAPDRLVPATLPHLAPLGSRGAGEAAAPPAPPAPPAAAPAASAAPGRWQPDLSKVPAWAGHTITGPWSQGPRTADGEGPSRSFLGEQTAAPPVRVTVSGGGNPAMARPGAPVAAPVRPAPAAAPAAPAAAPATGDPELARYIDHTLLKPEATAQQVEKLCQEAIQYGFYSVCVNTTWVPLCARLVKGTPVKVAAVIGFPLGAMSTTAKALEARDAVAAGAAELDMVINVGALKSGQLDLVLNDIRAVVQAAGQDAIVKVILETGLLTDEEKVRACELARQAGAHFVKTSTGFGPGGATVEDIALMRRTVGPEMGVKASGGIRDTETARKMIAAGATRLGASAGIAIVTGAKPAASGGSKAKQY